MSPSNELFEIGDRPSLSVSSHMWSLSRELGLYGTCDYQGESCEDVPLDEVPPSLAGCVQLELLRVSLNQRPRSTACTFAHEAMSFLMDPTFFAMHVLLAEFQACYPNTSKRWAGHLSALEGFKILHPVPMNEILHAATYFAVLKTETTSRSIFNGRRLS